MVIEICCSSISSVKNAINYGANRIELCQDLRNDGITPSKRLLNSAIKISTKPINVLIRPRIGDFFYNSEEIKLIEYEIKQIKSLPINGIVIGILNRENDLPINVLKKLVQIIKPLDLTFHRAFDIVNNPIKSMNTLIDIGFDRILTSGQSDTAEKGLKMLLELKEKANGKISIMPGGGINENNCHIFLKNGFNEIHLSAKKKKKENEIEPIADPEIIKKVVLLSLNHK
ncbi:MAG: copper homeostasis protein CutC [Flavobacteriaceae bacterium]|nr:copper homeostasis protein CutC [Flavobacteriaceae bacterium]|tara:strand:- start:3717 stop:4403 length:687 start_codon:yes stop_codon:yes gene_type:complete